MNHYDRKNGWEHTKPGWYEVNVYIHDPRETVTRHTEMLAWIYDNIGKCEHHCRWQYDGNYLNFKFRYERDYLWFKLRWA